MPEAAARLSVCRRTIERLGASRRLQIVCIGRSKRVAVAEIARFIRDGGTPGCSIAT